MSSSQIHLVKLILSEHFGSVVEKVAVHLLKKGPTPLKIIASDVGLKLDQVSLGLCMGFGCVDFCWTSTPVF